MIAETNRNRNWNHKKASPKKHASAISSAIENLESRFLLSGGGGGTGGGGGGGTGGGGGGGAVISLPAPAIPPGTFDGIGSGPTFIRESFGFGQGTRLKQNGDIKAVNVHTNINGIRAEFPNNKTETWVAPPEAPGGQEWDFAVVGPSDPYEAHTPLQDASFGDSDGILFLNGASFLDGTADQRPAALLPFAAPTTSGYTVSGDSVAFFGKTAIGFSTSSAVNKNFETSGQAWLEIDTTGNFPAGGSTFINKFVFHTNGLNGPSVAGTFDLDSTAFNRLAVSYDPVNHIAAASINGVVVASLPYSATGAIKYVGVEGSWNGNIDNFAVQAGVLNTPPATATLAPQTTFSTTPITNNVLQSSSASVLV